MVSANIESVQMLDPIRPKPIRYKGFEDGIRKSKEYKHLQREYGDSKKIIAYQRGDLILLSEDLFLDRLRERYQNFRNRVGKPVPEPNESQMKSTMAILETFFKDNGIELNQMTRGFDCPYMAHHRAQFTLVYNRSLCDFLRQNNSYREFRKKSREL